LRYLALIVLLVVVGCEVAPTKIVETQRHELLQVVEKTQKPLTLENDDLVILDARSSFDYGLDRVRGSLRFGWETLAEDAHSGELLRDVRQAALRLSLVGLTPDTPILVVGYGQLGQGEEGRLAWNLLYLGFQDVQVSSVGALRKSMTQELSPQAKNATYWKVSPREELQIDRAHFVQLTQTGKSKVVLIDVRSEKEYLTQSGALPNVRSFNIEWKQFYTPQGRPDLHFKRKLAELGVHSDDHIVVISNRGVRSGAAAYALLAMGFPYVQNFTAGRAGL
jgi:thiosulfate/3-mercaptopyruvate sulfurtransferase